MSCFNYLTITKSLDLFIIILEYCTMQIFYYFLCFMYIYENIHMRLVNGCCLGNLIMDYHLLVMLACREDIMSAFNGDILFIYKDFRVRVMLI